MSPSREAGKSKKKKTMKKKHKRGGLDMSPSREAGAKRKSKSHTYNVLVRDKSFRKVWSGSAKSPLAAAKKYVKAWRKRTHKKGGKKHSIRKIKFPYLHVFVARVGKQKYSTYWVPNFGVSGIQRDSAICKSTKSQLLARLTGKMPKACRTSKQKKEARAPFREAALKKYDHLLRK